MNKTTTVIISVVIIFGLGFVFSYFNPQHPFPIAAATPIGLLFYVCFKQKKKEIKNDKTNYKSHIGKKVLVKIINNRKVTK